MNGESADRQPVFDRSFLWFGVGLCLLMVGLLVGPRLPDDRQVAECVVNVHLPGPFGIGLNCDSPEMMRLAREPSALLEPHNPRQSRPGLIAAAAILARALAPMASLAEKLGIQSSRSDIDPQRIADALAKDIPGYVAYIILNVAILLATFYYFRRICAPWADTSTFGTILLASIGFLFAANDVVKAFVWSPHNQMFNILVPVFALYVSMRANSGALVQRRFAIFIGLMTGVGATAYPLFVIVLPCVAICALAFLLRHGARQLWSQSAISIVVLTVLAAGPEALWAAFVRLKTGDFYQHEMVAFGQVIWVFDAWHQGIGTLAAMWWSNIELLLWLAAPQMAPLAAVVLAVAVSWLASRSAGRSARPPIGPLAVTGVLVSAVTAAFYATVGLIVPRIAYSVIPALIVVAAAAALSMTEHDPARRRIVATCCVAVALVAAVYTVAKNGPYG